MMENDKKIIVGIDVGGTNTDCVIMRGRSLLASHKSPTTEPHTKGITTAVLGALKSASIEPSAISTFSLGTTVFVNAVVERSAKLARVAVLRLCQPPNLPPSSLPPFHGGFAADLRERVAGHYALLQGGYEYDGKETAAISEEEVKNECSKIDQKGLCDVVVCGAFSPLESQQEERVGDLVRKYLPQARITLSHQIGRFGLLERENAAILNASLRPLAEAVVPSFIEAFVSLGGRAARFFLTQNDGTLLPADLAMTTPVLTFASGPTNSMRGAAFLANVPDAIVVDVGGTTADIGVLTKGFPRQAAVATHIGGVRTNFRMPDVISLAIGGGTIVDLKDDDVVTVGPQSVGFQLLERARVFGGKDLTLSDVAVALGTVHMGDPQRVFDLASDTRRLQAVTSIVRDRLVNGIEQMRTGGEKKEALLLVGGGAVCVEHCFATAAYDIHKPPHFNVANAVGAAIAQVSGSVDKLYPLAGCTREQVINAAAKEAMANAVALGASPSTIEVVYVEDTKPAYDTGQTLRVIVKVVGDLDLNSEAPEAADQSLRRLLERLQSRKTASSGINITRSPTQNIVSPSITPTTTTTKKKRDGMWSLSAQDLDYISLGAGILGAGGGGSTFAMHLMASHLVSLGRSIDVISIEQLADDDLVIAIAFMGAPTVSTEKLPRGNEFIAAVRGLERVFGRKATALVSGEIGGSNAITPMIAAAIDPDCSLPVLDADGMGRAFPELQMFCPFIHGASVAPAALADMAGNTVAVTEIASPKSLENILRSVVVSMGCCAALAIAAVSGADLKNAQQSFLVKRSVSLAWHLGKRIAEARSRREDPVLALTMPSDECSPLRVLAKTGKIVDVCRSTEAGFARGRVIVHTSNADDEALKIEFQNENLIAISTTKEDARIPRSSGAPISGRVLAVTPDLVVIVDADTAEPIACEDLRYGLRVAVLAMPCDPLMCDAKAMPVVGPSAFGFKHHDPWPSLASTWRETKSAIYVEKK